MVLGSPLICRCAFLFSVIHRCTQGCIQISRFVTALTIYITMLPSVNTYAAPETWINPSATIFGSDSSKFGSALACSTSVVGLGHSYIAVGSPLANGGLGTVDILDPDGTFIQSLNTVGGPGRFGQAVAFVKDINGDSIQELLAGEPGSGGITGYAHLFLSTNNPANPYVLGCSFNDGPGTGDFVIGTSHALAPDSVHVMISNSASPMVAAYNVVYAAGSCTFNFDATYSQSGPSGSRFGQSVAEIFDADSVLLIGAPLILSNAGRVYSKSQSIAAVPRYDGAVPEQLGVAVVARPLGAMTDSIAFNAPFSASNGTVYVKTQSSLTFSDVCSQDIPMSDLPSTAAQSLAHMGSVFDNLAEVSGGGVTFASYRSELETGGSVAVFGAKDNICSAEKQINNCAFDQGQGQGQSNAGGPNCVDGSIKLLIVGSSGWQSNKGRVDIYREGDELPAAVPCTAPTNTPTATPTPSPTYTPTPSEGFGEGEKPILLRPSNTPPAPSINAKGRDISVSVPLFASRRFQIVGYLFRITFRPTPTISSKTLENIEAFNSRAKKSTIFLRRNRTTLRNLAPGSYSFRYQVQFRHKRTGTTTLGRLSKSVTVTVR